MLDPGIQEYIYTIGIVASFAMMIVSAFLSRKDIKSIFKKLKLKGKHLALALLIVALFITLEIALVKPTQQLYFDDVIYQGGAQDLLRLGQAWMCNYGSPTQCISGAVFHEPVGTAFNLALGFAAFGINRAVPFGEFILVSALSVLFVFFAGFLLFRRADAALLSELLMALSPALLVWAAPITSDILMMFYSALALFSVLVFVYKKSIRTASFVLFSLSLLVYMKVNALVYLVLIPLTYIILDEKSIKRSLRSNGKRIKRNLFNTKLLILLLVFLLAVVPEVMYVMAQNSTDTYGYVGAGVPLTCSTGSITATGTINLQNFVANVCGNILFWFNAYLGDSGTYHIMQPVFFTFLAILGIVLLILRRRRESIVLGAWFAAFFVLYTSFYAGGVTFGVDWRFMLSLIPIASLLGGIGACIFVDWWSKITGDKSGRPKKIAYAFIIMVILYSTLSLSMYLSVDPVAISQAQDARFYENFVYSNISSIPTSCLVFSFDPTLFNINNRSSEQLGDITQLLNPGVYSNYTNRYGCLVIDYGFWCYTPNLDSICTSAMKEFMVTKIAAAHFNVTGSDYSFYMMNGINSSRHS